MFRRLHSPRRREADIAIGVTGARGATLITRNAADFAGIPDLRVGLLEDLDAAGR